MAPFYLLIAGFAALVVSASIGGSTDSPRTKAVAGGVAVGAIVLIVICITIGLWEAWSPWELTHR